MKHPQPHLLVGRRPLVLRADDVEQHQAIDQLRQIERHPVGDAGAAVMAHDRKAGKPEMPHQRDHVPGHAAFRIRPVVLGGRRTGTAAVAAQIGCNDGVGARQMRRHAMPHGVRLRIAVQQQKPRTGAAGSNVDDGLSSVDTVLDKAWKEVICCRHPRPSCPIARQPISRRQKPSGQSMASMA